MNKSLNSFLKILFTFFLAIFIGAVFILAIGENPIDAYLAKGHWEQSWEEEM